MEIYAGLIDMYFCVAAAFYIFFVYSVMVYPEKTYNTWILSLFVGPIVGLVWPILVIFAIYETVTIK